MTDSPRANLLRIRSGYVQQMVDATALIADLPKDSEEAHEARQWLSTVRDEIELIDSKIRALGRV
jgi:hypothetical protein